MTTKAPRRPTDAQFEELKRKRDDAFRATIVAVCEREGWDPAKVGFHASNMGKCYCACPDGPCQHIWDGPEIEIGEEGQPPDGFSASCSRCGSAAISHDLRCMP